ncbi:MAG TPA: DUF3501 family protein [Bryobacteraceae bacterium]|nr:DUF3501 family protein [Bryobacteraceae bacterium]
MQPIDISEIKNIADYELERERWRPQILALKDRRRIRLGDHLTFLFENRETVRYQIQEMMRIERIVKPADIAHEVKTYNELVPAPGELSASLFIEYTTPEERAVKLRELLGLDRHIWLEVSAAGRTPALFDNRQIATDRLSSVQYIKFRMSPAQIRHWREGASLIADHPCYQAVRFLTPAELADLAADFV